MAGRTIILRGSNVSKYLETAAKANDVARKLLEMIPDTDQFARPVAAELITQLVNLSFRCSPRPAQFTVRFNAVKRAVQGLPVVITKEEKTDKRTGKIYNVLVTLTNLTDGIAKVEETENEDQ